MYQKIPNSTDILDVDTGRVIPADTGNFDYQQVQAFVGGGGVVADAVPVVPTEVTMRQARELMITLGVFDAINEAIAGMTGIAGKKAQNYWDKSQVVQRKNPLVSAIASMLGWDSVQLDTYFTEASKL